MSDKIVEFLQSSNTYIAKIRTASAMNPLLWLIAFLALPCFTLIGFIVYNRTDSILPYCIGSFFALIVFVYLAIYVYFAITKPENLRSENFVIEKMKTELIANQYTKKLPQKNPIPIEADNEITSNEE
ncbi:MAG: hypothetical protein KBF93_15295 [Leptospiraceae bacterium]|nr:hypothetical protein [Leptospiraceae bacterium]